MKRSNNFYSLKWTLIALLVVDIVLIGTIDGLNLTNSIPHDEQYKTAFIVLSWIQVVVIILGILGVIFENICFVNGLAIMLFISLAISIFHLYQTGFRSANVVTLVFTGVLTAVMCVYSSRMSREGGDGCQMC
ncbi:hypothetical protein HDE_12099 [Halotydeus destructor]|nr:hypothetical protein HDE_12099 [Halotydeus destructor]